MSAAILDVRDLTVRYRAHGGEWPAVRDVAFSLQPGRTLGIVGESGSGKSTLGHALNRLLPANSSATGEILFKGRDILRMGEREVRALRGASIAMVFQDPLSSLHPCLTIGRQMLDAQKAHLRLPASELRDRAGAMLADVGIPDARERMKLYPHQFSGGMRQRIMIATALLMQPDVLVADEPTSALDVTLQGQILSLLGELRDRLGTALVLISHDLGVVADIADDLLVMYAGEVVETAPTAEVLGFPHHPYSRALIEVSPSRSGRGRMLPTIPGRVPPPAERGGGCVFANRCAFAQPVCATIRPRDRAVGGRRVRCHAYDPAIPYDRSAGPSLGAAA